MYLLDTNILAYAMRHPRDRIAEKVYMHATYDLCISSVTYAELMLGVLKSANPVKNRVALDDALSGIDVLPFDTEEAEMFARIKADLQAKGNVIEDMDIMIAAHAKVGGHTLVTDNLKHMARVDGIEIENWIERAPER